MKKTLPVEKKVLGFFSKYPKSNFKKGEYIIRASDKKQFLIYYVIKGHVRQFATTKNGNEVTMNISKPTCYFPLVHTLNEMDNNYNFIAITDVEVYTTPVKDVLDFLKNNTDVLLDVAARFSRGLYGLLHTIESFATGAARTRILMLLATYAKRFGRKHENGTMISIPLTHKDFADALGLARETVSREIEKILKDKEAFVVKKHYIIPNLELLDQKLSVFTEI